MTGSDVTGAPRGGGGGAAQCRDGVGRARQPARHRQRPALRPTEARRQLVHRLAGVRRPTRRRSRYALQRLTGDVAYTWPCTWPCEPRNVSMPQGSFQTARDLFSDADDALFHKILYNKAHLPHMYLPDRSQIVYTLRNRNHNKILIPKTSDLNERHFLIRVLYKHCY